MGTLHGKVALVTGGSRGIGRAICKHLAREGATVAFTYSKSKKEADSLVSEITSSGGKAEGFMADANAPDTMPALAETVLKAFGTIDILVNNAGIFEAGMTGSITAEDYGRTMRVNVDSVFMLTNAAAQHMKSGGRIILIGSVLGERAAVAGLSVYNTSKFAVAGMGRSFAKDLGARGILVNVVQPGPINTDMNPDDSDSSESMKSSTALGRYGKPDEVAALVAFLAGESASYITGATINVDGGWNA